MLLHSRADMLGFVPIPMASGCCVRGALKPTVCRLQPASSCSLTHVPRVATCPDASTAARHQLVVQAQPAGEPGSRSSSSNGPARPYQRGGKTAAQTGPSQAGSSPTRSQQQQPAQVSTAGDVAKPSNAKGTPLASRTQAGSSRRPGSMGAGSQQGAASQKSGRGTARRARPGAAQHGRGSPPSRQSRPAAVVELALDDEDDDDVDVESVVEQEGDEAILDPDEIERLVFGSKDFLKEDSNSHSAADRDTEDTSTPAQQATSQKQHSAPTKYQQRQAAQLAASKAALTTGSHANSIPQQLSELAVSAAEQELVPVEADALVKALQRILEVVSELPAHQLAIESPSQDQATSNVNAPAVMRALWGSQSALVATGDASSQLALEEVLGAAVRVPGLLRLSHQDVRERMKVLPAMLNMPPNKMQSACCRHPEVLVAPLEEVRKKLLLLRNTTGLTGEAALDLMNPHMFGGM